MEAARHPRNINDGCTDIFFIFGSAWIHMVYVDARAWIHMVYVDAMAWIHIAYVIFDLCKITKAMYTVLFSS